jgi:hypothetical protein
MSLRGGGKQRGRGVGVGVGVEFGIASRSPLDEQRTSQPVGVNVSVKTTRCSLKITCTDDFSIIL